jgi:hypothetical protein
VNWPPSTTKGSSFGRKVMKTNKGSDGCEKVKKAKNKLIAKNGKPSRR